MARVTRTPMGLEMDHRDFTNSVTTSLTPMRHDADRPGPLQRAPAGPSAMGTDTTVRPPYTRTHARASMVSARERRVVCLPHILRFRHQVHLGGGSPYIARTSWGVPMLGGMSCSLTPTSRA